MSHLSVILPQSCDRGLLRSKRGQSQHDFQVDGLTAAPGLLFARSTPVTERQAASNGGWRHDCWERAKTAGFAPSGSRTRYPAVAKETFFRRAGSEREH
jgi:hypothetical protein